jgi:hypothetical protein
VVSSMKVFLLKISNAFLISMFALPQTFCYIMSFRFKYSPQYSIHKSWDSAVGIATGYRQDDRGVRV